MTSISALDNIHKKGFFGNYENKKDNEILKLSESKNLFICQIVKYSNLNIDEKKLKIDEISLPDPLKTTFNKETRILWMGPNNWLVVSKKLDLMKFITILFCVYTHSPREARVLLKVGSKNQKRPGPGPVRERAEFFPVPSGSGPVFRSRKRT